MPHSRTIALFALTGMVALAAWGGETPAPKLAGTDVPAPAVRSRIEPSYPEDAERAGISGVVIVEVLIDERGNVASAKLVSSLPALDEAALAAVRQWRFAVTRIAGKAVSVLHVVPVSFTLRLPEVRTQPGFPELRRGVTPKAPHVDSAPPAVAVVADLTLADDGSVVNPQVRKGEQPWADAVLSAVRSWRFAAPREGVVATLRLEAVFLDAASDSPRVRLALTGMSEAEVPAPLTAPPTSEPESAAVATPTPLPTLPIVPTTVQAAAEPEGPAIEVAGPAPTPPPPPPPPGMSAVAGVLLGAGVPDLLSGRRPVVPPFARIRSSAGRVTVRFSVDSAGHSGVQDVDGPTDLKEQASQAVRSWAFRRTSPERLFLTAIFSYGADDATAEVALR